MIKHWKQFVAVWLGLIVGALVAIAGGAILTPILAIVTAAWVVMTIWHIDRAYNPSPKAALPIYGKRFITRPEIRRERLEHKLHKLEEKRTKDRIAVNEYREKLQQLQDDYMIEVKHVRFEWAEKQADRQR